MADNTIEMEARLKNYISGELGKISSDVKKMSDTTKKSMNEASNASKAFQGIIAKFAVAQLAVQGINMAMAGFKRTLTDSIVAYKQQVQANQALASALGYTNEALLEYSSELQKTTTYGDEQITQAQALIAAFVKDEEQIKRLTRASLDLAAAKGMDLRSAADLLTKTVASETNAMQRYGISVVGAAGSAERLESAVKNIDSAFGGMAEALAQTDAGSLQQIENQIGDVQEEIGEYLIPYLIMWKTTQKEILEIVKEVASWFNVFENQGDKMAQQNQKWLDAEKKRLEDLIELRKKGVTDAVVDFSHGGLKATSETLDNLESRLRQVNSQIAMRGASTKTTGPGGFDIEAERKRLAAIKASRDEIADFEETWEAEQWAKDQELYEQQRAERERRDMESAEIAEAMLIERAALNDEYNAMLVEATVQTYEDKYRAVDEWETAQLELVRERGKELQMSAEEIQNAITAVTAHGASIRTDIAKAEADSISKSMESMTSSILSIMGAFIEDERAMAYTQAILGSAVALSKLIELAMEGSDNWYEALAKGVASAAEVIALWAPIFSDINSAPTGTRMVTNGPTQLSNGLVVGDNPGGREELTVNPLSSPNTSGSGGGGAAYQFTFNGVNEDTFMRMMRRLERTGKIDSITRVGAI